MTVKTKKLVERCNALLRTELGGVFQREGRNIGHYGWVKSTDKRLKFYIKTGHKEVTLPTGVVKLERVYAEKSVLPDGPEFENIWVMCHTDHSMPEDQWMALFGTEVRESCYWRPVMVDPMLDKLTGGDPNRAFVVQYVTLPPGKDPDIEVTQRFINLVKEARTVANEAEQLAELERKREAEMRQARRDFMKAYCLPSFLPSDNGGKAHAIVPGTINPDGTIREAAQLAARNRILSDKN